MRARLREALTAARVESFLMTFGDHPELRVPFTGHAPAVVNKLRTARAHGGTALVDAVWHALDEARARSRHRRTRAIEANVPE